MLAHAIIVLLSLPHPPMRTRANDRLNGQRADLDHMIRADEVAARESAAGLGRATYSITQRIAAGLSVHGQLC